MPISLYSTSYTTPYVAERTQSMNKKLTLFFGKTNPEFSNFYIAPFEIDGVTYNSSEHYFMYQKAKLFDPDYQQKIAKGVANGIKKFLPLE